MDRGKCFLLGRMTEPEFFWADKFIAIAIFAQNKLFLPS